MQLHEALRDIRQIRAHLAGSDVFRGYRALPVAFSGVVAFLAAVLQHWILWDPQSDLHAYMALWLGAAALSALGAATEMTIRLRRWASPLKREMTWLAVSQFLPSLVAGGLLTGVLLRVSPESVWMLPGLWQILFSLGVFASYRLLPRAVFAVALFYLLTGLACLALAREEAALSPWAMGIPFGLGQLLAAGILYWTLERSHDDA